MAFDVDNIITIKQLLNNSISNINFDYIKQVIIKNVNDCNLLYTQVCYLIKLFLLNDYEKNGNKYNDYMFDELFIRKCFKLIKTGEINNNDNENLLINRLFKFYNEYNSNQNNQFKFIKPDNINSITHITDALSRDIQTNITNNIILNYHKYIREYININLKLEFNKIDNNHIIKIYNDIINNTLYSDNEYHSWINKHKKLIIPILENNISIKNFQDGIDNHNSIFVKFIKNYVKENQNLLNLIHINNDDKKKTTEMIINYLIDKNNEIIDNKYNEWINESKNFIINDFNLSKKIDLDKELEINSFLICFILI